jgi:GTPase SAR1 family protein
MSLFNPENTKVILIGASEFEDKDNLSPIPAIKDNNVKFRKLLKEVVGINQENIHLLEDLEYSNQITSKISKIFSNDLDMLMVYYAGHGIYDSGCLYLATQKTHLNAPKASGALLSTDLLEIVIDKGNSKHIIFIFDCCFSGLAREKIDTKGKKVFLITATSATDEAKSESPNNKDYTAFTNELLLIFERGIDTVGEILTLQDIFTHLKKQLTKQNLPEPQITSYGSSAELKICENRAYRRDSSKIDETPENINVEPGFKLADSFLNELRNTEIVFQHEHKENIILNDIFVYPDLKIQKEQYDSVEIVESNSEYLSNLEKISVKILILGEEQSGKTALLKMLFQNYFSQGSYPLLVNGEKITSTDLKKIFSPLIKMQYDRIDYEYFVHSPRKKILLIDDFHLSRLNERYQKKFLDSIGKIFYKIIIVSDLTLKFNKYELEWSSFSDYVKYEILPFGYVLRDELINKWNSLGREETIEKDELCYLTNSLARHVNSIIMKNIVPSKPIYILIILQSLETAKSRSYELTSYGYCYQYFIFQSLQKAIKNDLIDTYINYLTEISYFIFKQGKTSVNNEQLEEFKIAYSKNFFVSSHESIIKILFNRGILKKDDDKIKFGYKYIFYFYVAKYLADHLDQEDCKKTIGILCEKLHVEKNSNILIFLFHHSKNQFIFDELLLHTLFVFDKFEEAKLDLNETKYLTDMLDLIPKLVLDVKRDVEKEKKNKLKSQDFIEKKNNGFEEENDETEIEIEEDTNQKILAEINHSIKSVEIIGQILRNRFGSLSKEKIFNLTDFACGVILRFLKFFINISSKSKNQLLELIRKLIEETHSNKEEKIARQLYLILNYRIFYGVIHKITNSLGSEQLIPIFDKLAQNNEDSPVRKLINLSIKLEFTKDIPKKEIENLSHELENNMIARRVLQEIVLRHIYLHYTRIGDKQWVASTLGIPIKSQIQIEQQKKYNKSKK